MDGINLQSNRTSPGHLKSIILAILDVVLRVPAIFFIDGLLNYQVPLPWQDQSVFSVVVTVNGLILSFIMFSLSLHVLLKVYAFAMATTILGASHWWNQVFNEKFRDAFQQSKAGDIIEDTEFYVYLFVQIVYATMFTVSIGTKYVLSVGCMTYSAFIMPIIFRLVLPAYVEQFDTVPFIIYKFSQYFSIGAPLFVLCATIIGKIPEMYSSARYAFVLVQHIIRNYGVHIFVEDQWRRLHVPTVLRVFWITRFMTQAVFLTVMLLSVEDQSLYTLEYEKIWDILSNLLISGCDSTLTVLGMSAIISSIAQKFGSIIQFILGGENDEDKHMGTVSAILFFILALQTGLSGLAPEQRLARLYRNFCLLLTAIMHFIHNMVNPVLMALSASHNTSITRHLRVLAICLSLLIAAPWLMIHIWNNYNISTWLLAVTAFCVEVCIKVFVSLLVYLLFIIDAYRNTFWEKLDDYVYYVKAFGNSIEFIFGIFLFGNGAWIMIFESGGNIRAFMMCIHAYFNIWQQAKLGWKVFMNRRTAVKKINSLPVATNQQLDELNDVCAICYQELLSACITPCNHYFHSLCLRKWLYLQDKCPLCHSYIYKEDKDNAEDVDEDEEGDEEEEEDVINNDNDEHIQDNEVLRHRQYPGIHNEHENNVQEHEPVDSTTDNSAHSLQHEHND
ncbi:E3 ubiquitin-protein ligase RNF139-like [Ptychodera flava]|uniref:E3 ubiquitin-protein ligase RNF139-like n=1 Tax=Ptychodera flava TaxID=63121 RepID=UPI00396A58AF